MQLLASQNLVPMRKTSSVMDSQRNYLLTTFISDRRKSRRAPKTMTTRLDEGVLHQAGGPDSSGGTKHALDTIDANQAKLAHKHAEASSALKNALDPTMLSFVTAQNLCGMCSKYNYLG
jgi:hypothetical protein